MAQSITAERVREISQTHVAYKDGRELSDIAGLDNFDILESGGEVMLVSPTLYRDSEVEAACWPLTRPLTVAQLGDYVRLVGREHYRADGTLQEPHLPTQLWREQTHERLHGEVRHNDSGLYVDTQFINPATGECIGRTHEVGAHLEREGYLTWNEWLSHMTSLGFPSPEAPLRGISPGHGFFYNPPLSGGILSFGQGEFGYRMNHTGESQRRVRAVIHLVERK